MWLGQTIDTDVHQHAAVQRHDDRIDLVAVVHGVAAGKAIDGVTAEAAEEIVVAGAAGQDIIAVATDDPEAAVGLRRAVEGQNVTRSLEVMSINLKSVALRDSGIVRGQCVAVARTLQRSISSTLVMLPAPSRTACRPV